ncbi:MAG: LytTR family DNA-binding domain-containing protein, partial [Bacteroidota bacterium]
ETIDLLILDIEMPNLSGIELVKSFAQRPLIIFSTAYPQYALESYDLDVVDYLLKPIRFGRFLQAINKVSERLKVNRLPELGPNSPRSYAPEKQPYLLIRADHKIYKVAYDDIAYIQSMKEYAAFHLHSGGKILALMALKQLEAELPAQHFVRIHRSYIIPVRAVTAVNRQFVQMGETKLPVGGHYWQAVRERLIT